MPIVGTGTPLAPWLQAAPVQLGPVPPEPERVGPLQEPGEGHNQAEPGAPSSPGLMAHLRQHYAQGGRLYRSRGQRKGWANLPGPPQM